MLKFILFIQICYAGQVCTPPMLKSYIKPFKDHKSCALAGYQEGINIIKSLNEDEVNKARPLVQFWCQPQENKDAEEKETST